MTLEETIIWLKDDIKEINRDLANEEISSTYAEEGIKVCEMAISAIKEVQQYREVGTVEQVKNQKDNLDTAYKIISDYESCGTVEECREARGKQKPRIPKFVHMIGEYNARFNCPVCELRGSRASGTIRLL